MAGTAKNIEPLVGARIVHELPKKAPTIRTITVEDVSAALREGVEDFRAMPVFGVTIGAVYALAGFFLLYGAWAYGYAMLAFPLLAGFALVGPFAAMGLYEASRRRDEGRKVGFRDILSVRAATTTPNIFYLGFILMFALFVWVRVALLIYALFFGIQGVPLERMLTEAFTTIDGLAFLVIGNAVGAGFAFVVFSISVVSFPYMLEKDVDPVTAVALSVSAVAKNALPLAGWALFIAVSLAVASAPAFLGLTVMLPVLGHATWRLYKRMIAHEGAA
ncbi:MAG: DUF2189 domain-containing protein [Rhodobacteraceae bacterium]|nr:MAG: DUF2189 domain-containing protein [Paracoccaceae bacterium]